MEMEVSATMMMVTATTLATVTTTIGRNSIMLTISMMTSKTTTITNMILKGQLSRARSYSRVVHSSPRI